MAGESRSAAQLKEYDNNSIVQSSVSESQKEEKATEKSLTDVIDEALPSVVGISAKNSSDDDDTWNMGSGVIVSEKGYIITNHHVVGSSPKKIEVTLYDGSVENGELVWSDKALDLAAVKIGGASLKAAKLGESENLKVGEDVIAIGNPLSLQFERSVTKGIVSATGRTITVNSDGQSMYMEDLIQTDASINPGNSGGPLLNSAGEVVGINTIRVQDAEGMGFAVPINICEGVISSLEESGSFETPYLGLYAYTAQTAKYLKKKEISSNGLFVISLDVKGPAYEAGIRYGDIIEEADGQKVSDMIGLRRVLFSKKSGEDIVLGVISKGTEKEFHVKVGSMNYSYAGVNQ
jgi:S1-C subfamily serine protease